MRDHHWLDGVFEVLLSRPRMFADGWGAREVLDRVIEAERPFEEIPRLAPEWGEAIRRAGIARRRGTFLSPAASPPLPPEARTGHALWLTPDPAPVAPAPTYVVLAASGEAGFARRESLLAPLVRQGFGAVLVENPYYGLRRPRRQRGAKVRTVADQFVMNATTIAEAVGLAAWLRAEGHARIGLTGYSMGGHMAAYAACHLAWPVAVVPAAAGLSPVPIYTEGALRRAVCWPRLSAAGGPAEARRRLGALLARISETLPPLHPGSSAILVAARRDGFVFAEQVERLHARWPGSELRWVDGGHVSCLVRSAHVIRSALADAMTRLQSP